MAGAWGRGIPGVRSSRAPVVAAGLQRPARHALGMRPRPRRRQRKAPARYSESPACRPAPPCPEPRTTQVTDPQSVPPATPDGVPPAQPARTSPPDVNRPPTIVVDHVTKRFGDLVAVDDVALTVPEGTILGVIGPSGAGKTTVVRMLTGAIEPTDGSVRVLGENPRRFRRRTRQRIGYMPQLFSLYPDLSARENVDFVASLF